MRVLHFFKTYWPDTFGGVERVIDAIARSTAAGGVETTVLSLSRNPGDNTVTFHGHRAIKARLDLDIASTGFSASALALFRQEARRADIVHYHFPWPFMDLVHFAARPPCPTVVTYHSDIVKQETLKRLYAPLMNRFLSRVDRIVATSPDYKRTSPVLTRFRAKTDVIPIGIDDEAATVDAARVTAWRQRFPRPYFVFTGVLRYYKGLSYLIEAADAVPADILIIGSGPLRSELEALAAARPNVHLIGHVDDADKHALLSAAHGFVFPSHLRSEAFGVALAEGAMFGLPLISAAIGSGTSFVNEDGVTGIEVAPANAPALAVAMNTLLDDPAKAHAMGQAARSRFERHLTAAAMGEGYLALYRRLLSQPCR